MSWPTVPLPEVFWFQEGPGLRNWQFTTEGIKILNVGNIMPDGSIDLSRTDRHLSKEEFEAKYSHFSVDEGDLVIASSGISFDPDGYLRTKIGFIEEEHLPLCMNTSTIRFKATEGVSCLRYLKHWFQSHEFRQQVSQRVTGSAQLNFGPSHLKTMKITLPPLEEQRRVAGILDQADALRRLRTRALDKLNTLGQAIFHDMFGDPLKEQRSSPGWTLETLDDSISYIDYRGKTPPKAPDGIRLITAKNVKMGYINPEPMEFIVKDAFTGWMTRGFPKKGDVLFTTEAPLGNVAILDSDQTLAVGQRLLTMQPDQSKLTSEYLAFYLRTPEFTKRMIENSSGSTVRGIKSKLLKKIEICYPSLAQQRRFAEALNAHNSNISTCESATQRSHALFASLQHRAFRGEL